MIDQNVTTFFNKIYDETYRKTLLYVTSKCGSIDDIPDILQEIYIEVYSVTVKKGIDYVKNAEAFVMQLTKTKLYKHYAFAQKLKHNIPLFSYIDEGEEINILDFETEDYSVEDQIITKDLLNEIWCIVKSKPEQAQKIFCLFYIGGLTIPEITKELSCSESNVKNNLYRTVNEIRTIYRKGGESNE
jgi:RNA polymerase sigma-70 factor (ECF subfamily)